MCPLDLRNATGLAGWTDTKEIQPLMIDLVARLSSLVFGKLAEIH